MTIADTEAVATTEELLAQIANLEKEKGDLAARVDTLNADLDGVRADKDVLFTAAATAADEAATAANVATERQRALQLDVDEARRLAYRTLPVEPGSGQPGGSGGTHGELWSDFANAQLQLKLDREAEISEHGLTIERLETHVRNLTIEVQRYRPQPQAIELAPDGSGGTLFGLRAEDFVADAAFVAKAREIVTAHGGDPDVYDALKQVAEPAEQAEVK